ncbi:MAG TPA: DinB family protein [Dehalococcoidia bacterium]|nr:DinB family protein [Dehalococcoidia bacterium]
MKQLTAQRLRTDLVAARGEFHAALDALSDADWRGPSRNPGWTNGEVLFHAFLGFRLTWVLIPFVRLWGRLPAGGSRRFARGLNGTTGPFNALNAFAARLGARLYSRKRLGRAYDGAHRALLRRLATIPEVEWQRGMHYPTRWDPLFSDFMTLEQTVAMPIAHLRFHLGQVAGTRK